MKSTKIEMNIDFDENYDEESDIYYVSFKTGEPSYAVEVDDFLLIEEGVFTGLPTGFRILNFRKNHIKEIHVLIQKIRKTIEKTAKNFRNRIRERESKIEEKLESMFV